MPNSWDMGSSLYNDELVANDSLVDGIIENVQQDTGFPLGVCFAADGSTLSPCQNTWKLSNDGSVLFDGPVDGQKMLPQNVFHHLKVVYDGPEELASLQRGSRFYEDFEQKFKYRVADVLEVSQKGLLGPCSHCNILTEAQRESNPCSWMYSRYAGACPPSGFFDDSQGWGGISLENGLGNRDVDTVPRFLDNRATNISQVKSETFTMCKDMDSVEVFDLLGCGSFGKVYRARVNGVERAVKFLSVELQDLERVLREAEIGCFLQHPNIVRTFAYRICDADHEYLDAMTTSRLLVDPDFSASKRNRVKFGTHYDMAPHTERIIQMQIVQELCDVGPLSRHIHSNAFFQDLQLKCSDTISKLECIILIALDIINALIYLGYNGIIHGDLSSDNILFMKDSTSPIGLRAKVVDFGRSRIEKGRSTRTNSLGTVMYMPPEMLLDGNLNKTSDLYSVGVLVTEMWTNTPAWQEKQPVQILFAMSSGKRIEIPPDFPQEMQYFVSKCLSDDSLERPTTEIAFEMLKDMLDPKILAAHLVGTCVATRLSKLPRPTAV